MVQRSESWDKKNKSVGHNRDFEFITLPFNFLTYLDDTVIYQLSTTDNEYWFVLIHRCFRYITQPNITASTNKIWYGMHGATQISLSEIWRFGCLTQRPPYAFVHGFVCHTYIMFKYMAGISYRVLSVVSYYGPYHPQVIQTIALMKMYQL